LKEKAFYTGEVRMGRAKGSPGTFKDGKGPWQSADFRISVDGIERISRFVGDGIIIAATPAGSTADFKESLNTTSASVRGAPSTAPTLSGTLDDDDFVGSGQTSAR